MKHDKELYQSDVLIIGVGIAGASCALEIAKQDKDKKIIVLTGNHNPAESNTRYAQGGIIAKGGDDLVKDILKSSDGIGLRAAARVLAAEGPGLVQNLLLDFAKVPFDSNDNEQLQYALEGGHSEARVAKVADYTGKSIEDHLIESLRKFSNIQIISGFTAIDLLTTSHHSTQWQEKYKSDRCLGVYAFNQATGKVSRFLAKSTVLATGGNGQIYAFTTNPQSSRGDGIAMAYRAGVRLQNMEYEQFHPTALKVPNTPPFLISEAVRGQGARLTNSVGIPFMQNYYPDLSKPDLTTRDKVARAIFTEMIRTGAKNVYLDLKTYIPKEEILSHFPVIYQTCLQYGVDITSDLVPVSPAAHYSCGGILTDLHGRTSLTNLYAIGEVSCTGLHGGNRLASTSLLEGLVFGVRAAKSIIKISPKPVKVSDIPSWIDQSEYDTDPALIAADRQTIQNIMWNMVGLVRKTKLLERAITDLTNLEETITKFYRKAVLTDELIGLRNMSQVAILVAKAALANTKSIGCHYREK